MSTTISGKAVFAQLMAQTIQHENNLKVVEITQPFVELLPDILADLLKEPATLITLMKAKLAFYRYCFENGLHQLLVDAYPDLAPKGDPETVKREVAHNAAFNIDCIERLSLGYRNFRYKNYSEFGLMTSELFDLNNEVIKLYITGELTIGRLLELQPSVFIDLTVVDALS